VLKDLGSKWEPSDRSGKWLKLKPDYIRAGSDLDVLVIGLYFIYFFLFSYLFTSKQCCSYLCFHAFL
jgi:polyferredoxin